MNTTRPGAARSWAMSVNSVEMTSKRFDLVVDGGQGPDAVAHEA